MKITNYYIQNLAGVLSISFDKIIETDYKDILVLGANMGITQTFLTLYKEDSEYELSVVMNQDGHYLYVTFHKVIDGNLSQYPKLIPFKSIENLSCKTNNEALLSVLIEFM